MNPLIENLRISIDRLQTGLTALNREVPRIEVMAERAELVIESLQSELKEQNQLDSYFVKSY